MALADWLLPLLLLASDDEGGHPPFDWTTLDAPPVTSRAPAQHPV